jgi:hypothetical protein
MTDAIYEARVKATNDLISSNQQIKKLLVDNKSYWDQIKNYSVMQLVSEIQPKWNKQNSLSEKEATKLTLLMLEYRLRGLDMEYFTCGAGAPGNCCIS